MACPGAAVAVTVKVAVCPATGGSGVRLRTMPDGAGTLATVINLAVEALAPALSVTVSTTVYGPGFEYVCVTIRPLPVEPSPKFHAYVQRSRQATFSSLVADASN